MMSILVFRNHSGLTVALNPIRDGRQRGGAGEEEQGSCQGDQGASAEGEGGSRHDARLAQALEPNQNPARRSSRERLRQPCAGRANPFGLTQGWANRKASRGPAADSWQDTAQLAVAAASGARATSDVLSAGASECVRADPKPLLQR